MRTLRSATATPDPVVSSVAAEGVTEARPRRRSGDGAASPAADGSEVVTAPAGETARSRDLTAPVCLAVATGLLLMAFAARSGREAAPSTQTDALFWGGLMLMVGSVAARVLWSGTSSRERLQLTLLLPVAVQLSRVLLYPTRFVYHDELAHANTLRLIQSTHHLFALNPLLPASSSYPGLELATDGVHSLTGLADRPSAVAVLLLAKLTMTLALLGVFRALGGSNRLGAVACLLYACNPQFLFFNSQYSYQSLSLPLAVLTLHLLLTRLPEQVWWRRVLPAGLALVAVVVTHHLTGLLLIAVLVVWGVVEFLMHRRSATLATLALVAGLGVAFSVAWVLRPGNTVLSYLGSIAESSATQVTGLVQGDDQSRQLFADGSGERTPAWQRWALLVSLAIVTCGVLASVLEVRRWFRARNALATILCLVALAYPVIPGGHLTPATSEVTDRVSGFLFIGLALLLGGWLLRRWPLHRVLGVVALAALVVVAFVGQSILALGPNWARTPGPFLVSADSRSVDGYNLAAADWEAVHLPPDQRVMADRVGRLLAGAVGRQYSVTHLADGVDASRLLLGAPFGQLDRDLIASAKIRYVVVDERDATGLPRIGVYYESGELDGRTRTAPVPLAALTKLAAVPGVQRVYDNGAVVIYDVGALR